MKIDNPTGKTVEELQMRLSGTYPDTKIKNTFFGIGPKNLIVPFENFKHVVRPIKKGSVLVVDFMPPVYITVLAIVLGIAAAFVMAFIVISMGGNYTIGGVLWMVIVLLILKYFFKSKNKEKFDKFYSDLNLALMGSSEPGSLF